jgi:hypothetical protein
VLGQYLRSARYYHPSQIAARFRLGISSSLVRKSPWLTRRRYSVSANVGRNADASFLAAAATVGDDELAATKENAQRLAQGIFRLINEELPLGFPVPWQPSQTGRLWRYNLHYFDYALDLAMLVKWRNDEQAAGVLARLFRDWIEANPIGHGVGWHSYPIARRIVNWIQAFSLASPSAIFKDEASEAKWLTSLYQQARFLEDHLEYDCLGNHLLANGKALVFAGLFFGGKAGSRWFNIGQRILWNGLQDQLLEDGGHQERSPMYHSIVLQDYLEVVLALQLNGRELPDWVRTTPDLHGGPAVRGKASGRRDSALRRFGVWHCAQPRGYSCCGGKATGCAGQMAGDETRTVLRIDCTSSKSTRKCVSAHTGDAQFLARYRIFCASRGRIRRPANCGCTADGP